MNLLKCIFHGRLFIIKTLFVISFEKRKIQWLQTQILIDFMHFDVDFVKNLHLLNQPVLRQAPLGKLRDLFIVGSVACDCKLTCDAKIVDFEAKL